MKRVVATTLVALGLLASGAGAGTEYRCVAEDERVLSRELFVQGLEFDEDALWLSSGLYGRSKLIKLRFADLTTLEERRLPTGLFAEGLTLLDDRVLQLTWRAGVALVWNTDPLVPAGSFRLPGQGWGIAHGPTDVVYSDGSHRLYFLDRVDFRIVRVIDVLEDGRPVPQLNELEWIEGRIWANVWQSEDLLVINPADGSVSARIDCSGLLPFHLRRPGTDVFNGIARKPDDGSIWVTGKRWPRLYRIRVEPALPWAKPSEAPDTPAP